MNEEKVEKTLPKRLPKLKEKEKPINIGYRQFVTYRCEEGACKDWDITGQYGITTDKVGASTFYVKVTTTVRNLVLSKKTVPN